MYIQGIDSVYDLAFNDEGVTYGEVFLENEREFSAYNFEVADTDSLFAASATPPRNAAAASRRSCRSPPTTRRSRPATSSTRCRPAA